MDNMSLIWQLTHNIAHNEEVRFFQPSMSGFIVCERLLNHPSGQLVKSRKVASDEEIMSSKIDVLGRLCQMTAEQVRSWEPEKESK